MILRLLKRMTPGLDVKAIAEEIKERIVEELDYELEAQNQRSLARIFAGHPFIVVPDVVSSLSRERVLVGEFVSGVGFEELKSRSQAERDRLGEIELTVMPCFASSTASAFVSEMTPPFDAV